jgi:methyl-accepting chemotaxis protein
MTLLSTLPVSGKFIIAIILFLFIIAFGLLVILKNRYSSLCKDVNLLFKNADGYTSSNNPTIKAAIIRYKMGYHESGADINTPAIVDSAMESVLKGSSLMERFLKNVVSLLITLGLLGTFIGLTMAVGDLASMFGNGDTADVLATLEIVGSGLLSALSGMGVAFTTSLIGIGCSIIFTVANIIISPMQEKEKFTVLLEDYLDNYLAPQLKKHRPDDNAAIMAALDDALSRHSATISESLKSSSQMLHDTAIWLNDVMKKFATTCDSFNGNVRDFSEFNHNLRNNIERMDVNFIRLVEAMRENSDKIDGSRK